MDQETLKQYLNYNPDTGEFTRLIVTSNRAGLGKCSSQRKDGYYRIQINGKRYYAHRLAFLYMTGSWPKYTVDHIDGDTSNNRWANLRDVRHAVNIQNRTRPNRDSTTGYLGVYYSKKDKKYIAQCMMNTKSYVFGYFNDPLQASIAVIQGKKNLAGDIADVIESVYE